MANYRPIFTKIWKDPDFQMYKPNAKLIFLYLCTNPSTTESGIYPVTFKTMSDDTGLPMKTVETIFTDGLKNVSYDPDRLIVFIHRFLRYNGRGNPKIVKRSIELDFEKTPETYLWQYFTFLWPVWAENIPISPLEPPSSISISNSISISISKQHLDKCYQHLDTSNKIKHLGYVYLTSREYDRLLSDYGESNVKQMIEVLDNYIGAKPSKRNTYEDHNRVLRGWVKDKLGIKKKGEDSHGW